MLVLEYKNLIDLKSEQAIIENIYGIAKKYISGLFHDDYWAPKDIFIKELKKYGEIEFNEGNGQYQSNKDGEQWKEWIFTYTIKNKYDKTFKLNFKLSAYQAGTVEDPWDSYDLVLTRQYLK